MSLDDPLQQNIRRTAGLHALKKIGAIVDEENRNDAAKAAAVRNIVLYGSLVLMLVVTVLGYVMGVY
ncbi:MAG: hypothetical protein A2100_03635 [Sideroxydans sp. GWF2_59_14]|nr:MAG: hypothetical protein A2100_03635 [Sideroxydans sp. GWF2_59_14]HAF45823.1 hypothetical protein [Gallionellaceae bacterium]